MGVKGRQQGFVRRATGVVPRLVLEHSAVRDRPAVVPADPPPEQFPIGLCVRRADLRRPLVAALWSL